MSLLLFSPYSMVARLSSYSLTRYAKICWILVLIVQKICSEEYCRSACIALGVQAALSMITSELTMVLFVLYYLDCLLFFHFLLFCFDISVQFEVFSLWMLMLFVSDTGNCIWDQSFNQCWLMGVHLFSCSRCCFPAIYHLVGKFCTQSSFHQQFDVEETWEKSKAYKYCWRYRGKGWMKKYT